MLGFTASLVLTLPSFVDQPTKCFFVRTHNRPVLKQHFAGLRQRRRRASRKVEADRVEPGHLDPASGAIQRTQLDHPEVEDLLDDVAEAVLQTGGEVIVVPKERMPSSSGVAATYRY